MKVVLIGGLLGIMGIIPKLISGFKMVGTALGGIGPNISKTKDALLGLAKTAKSGAETFAKAWSSGTEAGMSKLGKMKSSIMSVFKKGGTSAAESIPSKATDTISKGTGDIVKKYKRGR